jgi:hypothetical protein
MKPRIESIESANAESLESIDIQDMENFHVWVTALIGPSDRPGEEIFSFSVCSPQWIAEETSRKGYFLTRRLLVMSYWDTTLVKRAIEELVSSVTGDSWHEIARKLATISYWEFEDYTDAKVTSE